MTLGLPHEQRILNHPFYDAPCRPTSGHLLTLRAGAQNGYLKIG